MIQINLLQQTTGKSSRSKAVKGQPVRRGAPTSSAGVLIIIVTAVLMVLINGVMGWMSYRGYTQSKAEFASVKTKYDDLKQKISSRQKNADTVRQFREVVSNQMDVLRSLDPPDRILWCEKINMLANLVPPNVFISEVNIKENVEMVETNQSKAAHADWLKLDEKVKGRTKEPPVVKRPVIHYVMGITGLALGQDNVEQFNNVLKFHKALNEYKTADAHGAVRRFMDGFQPGVELGGPIEASTYEGAQVNKFIFNLTSKSMGGDEPTTAKTNGAQVASK